MKFQTKSQFLSFLREHRFLLNMPRAKKQHLSRRLNAAAGRQKRSLQEQESSSSESEADTDIDFNPGKGNFCFFYIYWYMDFSYEFFQSREHGD